MAESVEEKIDDLEAQLASIADATIEGEAAHSTNSVAILIRQADLLVQLADAYEVAGDPERAISVAQEAESLVQGLGRQKNAEPVLSELWVKSQFVLGKGFISVRRLVDARAVLRRMERSTADGQSSSRAYVDDLAKALHAEESNRAKIYSERFDADMSSDRAMQDHWMDVEHALNTLISEIAAKVAEAGNLLQRTAQPERFQDWLMHRLSVELRRFPSSSPPPDDESMDQRFLEEALERGKELQRAAFNSPEMYHASSLHIAGKQATDEDLKTNRAHGRLLGLAHPDDPTRFVYPVWQFDGVHREVILRTLNELKGVSPWGIWNFFHAHRPELFELSVLEALRLGGDESPPDVKERIARLSATVQSLGEAVVAAARAHVKGQD